MNILIQQSLTVEQRLHKAVSDIMMQDKYIALAGLLAIGDRSVRDDIPTACTNGRDERYGVSSTCDEAPAYEGDSTSWSTS